MTKTKTFLLVALGTLLTVAPAAGAKTPRCNDKAPTVAATETVRVFATGKGDIKTRDLWACRREKKKAVFLFDGARNETWSAVKIAGDRYASVIGRYESPVDGLVDIDLHRVDVAKRKSSSWSTPMTFPPADIDVQLLDDGTFAAINRRTDGDTLVLSRFGQTFSSPGVVVDSGVPAQLSQVATRDSRLYWMNNGFARTLAPGSTIPVAGNLLPGVSMGLSTLTAKKGNACEKGKGLTMFATPAARVFMVSKRKGKKVFAEDIFMCRRNGGKPVRVIHAGKNAVYGDITIAGRYLLTAKGTQPAGNESSLQNTTLTVRDIATRATTATVVDPALDIIPDAVLAPSGIFAYIRGATVVIGRTSGTTVGGATAPKADLAGGSAAIYWMGADNLPHVSG